jgi:hypothetical protein
MDLYAYKQMSRSGTLLVDVDRELFKQNEHDDYQVEEADLTDQTIEKICTTKQLEIFHRTLVTDLYRRDRIVDFTVRDDEKKYYIVPLRLSAHDNLGKIQYQIDRKMI